MSQTIEYDTTNKQRVSPFVRYSIMFWYPLILLGVVFCVFFLITEYNLPITEMPGYYGNQKLQNYLQTKQFGYELVFDYTKFGMKSMDFFPVLRDYKFYKCRGLAYKYHIYYPKGSFTYYQNWADKKELGEIKIGNSIQQTIQTIWEDGTTCKQLYCSKVVHDNVTVVAGDEKVQFMHNETVIDYIENGVKNCELIGNSGFVDKNHEFLVIGKPKLYIDSQQLELIYISQGAKAAFFTWVAFCVIFTVAGLVFLFYAVHHFGCNCKLLFCYCCKAKANEEIVSLLKASDEDEVHHRKAVFVE